MVKKSKIKDTPSKKIHQVIETGKENISKGLAEYKKNKEEQENIQAVRTGFSKAKKDRLTELKEEAKLKALLEFRAKQELLQQYQKQQILSQPQIQSPLKKSDGIFSFTNRPFMETDPFIGDNPFFPRRRRPL